MRPILSRAFASLLLCLVLLTGLAATAAAADPLFARIDTDNGPILVVFYPELAPHHVASFVHLARTGFFNGTRFHRIVPGFVIQGGDPNSKDDDPRNDGMGGPQLKDILTPEEEALVAKVNDMLAAKGYAGITGEARLKAEFSKTAQHLRGTLSMARSRDVDSAGSQFFICVDRTAQLDGQYTIFGQVVSGMDVVDSIVNAEKQGERPAIPVAINGIGILEGTGSLTPEELAAWNEMPAGLKNVK